MFALAEQGYDSLNYIRPQAKTILRKNTGQTISRLSQYHKLTKDNEDQIDSYWSDRTTYSPLHISSSTTVCTTLQQKIKRRGNKQIYYRIISKKCSYTQLFSNNLNIFIIFLDGTNQFTMILLFKEKLSF